MNTPVGQEERLKNAGISISDDDDELPESTGQKTALVDNSAALKNGEGLLLVDLLKLRKTFSAQNYRVDLKGFGISWVIVIGYLLLAYGISQAI